jgi:hypothetical protein
MIGISQLQFPSKGSSRLKFVSYSATFVSLSIITNPVSVLFSLGTIFFRSEIKTLYIYREIKTAKQQKMSKREYWEIFFKNNAIKVAAFLLFSAFITYLTFTSTFLLISLLGTIPLTMLLVLLQSELRPKDFNPFTLLKASMNFFREGMKENLRGLVNSFDIKLEHLLPHQLNQLKAEGTIEGQVVRMLDGLKFLPQEKNLYRVYSELSRNNENDKKK